LHPVRNRVVAGWRHSPFYSDDIWVRNNPELAAARRLEGLADRAGKLTRQIRQRLAGEKISDRLVSMADPDARPIRKGKLRAPTEFGFVIHLAEVRENTRRGARGLIVPVASEIGHRTSPTCSRPPPPSSSA